MSLAILEKKWRYLEKKEKLVRDTFDSKKDKFVAFAVPKVIKDRLQTLVSEDHPSGYDPFRACNFFLSVILIDRKDEPLQWTARGVDDYIKMLEFPEEDGPRNTVRPRRNHSVSKAGSRRPTLSPRTGGEASNDDTRFVAHVSQYLEKADREREESKEKFNAFAQASVQQRTRGEPPVWVPKFQQVSGES